jgi:hypothetical protein
MSTRLKPMMMRIVLRNAGVSRWSARRRTQPFEQLLEHDRVHDTAETRASDDEADSLGAALEKPVPSHGRGRRVHDTAGQAKCSV